jgi:threonine dehydrogenase-like Zn-dependent dehydrogenase
MPLRNCVPGPDALSDELVALAEPLLISMQAVASDVLGRHELVMGPATIGQRGALLARQACAAQVVVSSFDDSARLHALRRMDSVCSPMCRRAAWPS